MPRKFRPPSKTTSRKEMTDHLRIFQRLSNVIRRELGSGQ
jgi:hypothetical protein